MELMTKEHPLWEQFFERLEGPEGCNFTEDKKENIEWKCKNDHAFTRKILTKMGNIDVENSLLYFSNHGGHCDCEILFNT